jgi:hypothetical protein
MSSKRKGSGELPIMYMLQVVGNLRQRSISYRTGTVVLTVAKPRELFAARLMLRSQNSPLPYSVSTFESSASLNWRTASRESIMAR